MSEKPKKPYWEMNLDELREATKEFDREFIADEFKPLTPEMRSRWERAKRAPGRPRIGKGAKVISVSLEQGLLQKSDRLAKKLGVTRAALISRGLRLLLDHAAPPASPKSRSTRPSTTGRAARRRAG